MISVQEALGHITRYAKSFGMEVISIEHASGRVIAQDVVADRDYPPFNRSAMDGYAVKSADLKPSPQNQFQVIEQVLAGSLPAHSVTSGKCIKIMTGAPVPAGADAVIRIEDATSQGQMVALNPASVKPGKNIAWKGEDARKGDILLKHNKGLDAPAVTALAVTGYATLLAEKLPQVAIVSTGNEIIPVGAPVFSHQIRDSNSFSIKSALKRFQVHSPVTAIVPDDKTILKETIHHFLDKDIIIVSGGVSKGDADYVPEVLTSLGIQQIFHQVKVKPGAPLWFGISPNGGVVFGLPGNPLSVQIACRIFLEPYLSACFGIASRPPVTFPFVSQRTKKSKADEFFPCRIVAHSPYSGLLPVEHNGSGDITSTLHSDGIALHPTAVSQLTENTPVDFYFW